jgi:2-haloacid dehalogenase
VNLEDSGATSSHGAGHVPPTALIFDVNETLLDLESLNPHFASIFGDAAVLRKWFGELVTYSMTVTLSGCYVDFFTLGQAVLQMVCDIRGVDLSEEDRQGLAEAMRTMPAHADVASGLARLRSSGYRLVTLTNSPHRPGASSPLENAGLGEYFERQFTVDALKAFKPSPVLYTGIADEIGVPPSQCMMVAAHTWDTIGAQGAGMQSALITRPGNAALKADGIPYPTIVVTDLDELAERLAGYRAA